MLNAITSNTAIGINIKSAKAVKGNLNFFAVTGKSPVLTSEGINRCAAAMENANAATNGANVQIEVK
jgi:hypothetical protein